MNLYQVKDGGEHRFVVARSIPHAIELWNIEFACDGEPEHIQLITDDPIVPVEMQEPNE